MKIYFPIIKDEMTFRDVMKIFAKHFNLKEKKDKKKYLYLWVGSKETSFARISNFLS